MESQDVFITDSSLIFFENLSVFHCVFDSKYHMTLLNPAFQKKMGYTDSELLSQSFLDYVHTKDRDHTLHHLESLHSQKTTDVLFESRFRDKSGIFHILSWSCFSKYGNIYATARDLTEEKKRDSHLNSLEKKAQRVANSSLLAMGEMAGGIAHEINNPLTIIHGRACMLKQLMKAPLMNAPRDVNKTSLINMISNIEETSIRISKIIQSLRHFARDCSTEVMENITLKKIIEDALCFCNERFKSSHIKLIINDFNDEITLTCRPAQISQVLLTLLNNSFYEVKNLEEKWVKINVADREKFYEISVTDSGKGIPVDVSKRLFDPFFTTKPLGLGTGIGLNLAKSVIESHRGVIAVDDSSPNTRFVITFPKNTRQKVSTHQISTQEVSMNTNNFSILVVDDEEDIRSMISDILRHQNYECITAENGKEAFEAICSKKIDAVISDVIMPELGGIALLDKVKKRNVSLPHLALISGFTETPLADIYDKGAEAFLAKPFEISALLSTLDHLLKPMETWSEVPFSEEGNQERVYKCTFSSMKAATNEKRLILGRGGCFLNSKYLTSFPTVGTKVRFHFDFEKKDHAAIHGQGTVRWVRKNKQSTYDPGLGIEFDILDKNSRIEFLEDVKKIQTTAFIPKG